MADRLTVKQNTKLLEFLFASLPTWPKKTVKQRLQGGSVAVNSTVTTQHDAPLKAGDVVEVGVVRKALTPDNSSQKLEILYQDKEVIAINKPVGLLSVGTTSENKNHALALLRHQLSHGKNQVKLWPVHRLDRDTSGILLFATSKELREAVMDKWGVSQKIYLAIVEGVPKQTSGTIDQPLRLDEKLYCMHVGKHKDALPALTHYRLLKSTTTRSLLEVRIETGRQHQIRAHMAWLGCPIVGDERYGKKGDKMGLHAMRLKFVHPVTKKEVLLEVDAPKAFYGLLG